MSSDGFPDQFGGPENRKYGSRRMRELLERINQLPMEEQSEAVKGEHLQWRGNGKQIDDILVVGVKVV